MKTKQCLQCHKVFQKPCTESVKNWETRHKYCSRKCSSDSKKEKPLSEERKQQNREWSTGRKHTEASIKK